tara:strand:- start:24460 stop:26247 length:1788 start_codon:yes stop_codon:yes gene_type:complete
MNKTNDKLNLIIKLFNNGKKDQALSKIELLLKSNKKNIEVLIVHAKICISLNKIEKSNFTLENILNLDPNNSEAIQMIYVNFLKIKKFEFAEKYIDKLISLNTESYEIFRDKAFIEYINKRFSTAEEFMNKAININSNDVFGLNIMALINIEKRDLQIAINFLKKAISINPKYIDSYNNLGKCFIDLEKLSQAYLCFKKAYKINPYSELPIINLANILTLKGKNNLAIKFLNKAKKINPKNNIIDENISINKCKLKDIYWVKNYYHQIKNSKNINYDFVLGYSYLLLNNYQFEEGFKLMQARLNSKNFQIKNIYHSNILNKLSFDKDLDQKDKLLVIKEQGVGDEILFGSIYNDLLKECTNVKIECDKRLVNIFTRSFQKKIFFEYGHFSSSIEKIDEFDKVLYAGTLTKYFRRNIDDFNEAPYLKTNEQLDADINKQISKLGNNKKIGISWKSIVNIYGELKSLKLENFYKLFNKNRSIINVQYGDVSKDLKKLKDNNLDILNFKNIDLFNDFDSLISILKNIDVFVTVSNSTAHFAGAIGVPTILICPNKSSTFYYWDYDNGKTPWYNNISIIKFENSIESTMRIVDEIIEKL